MRYILIAGVNGAGKSTLYQTLESFQGMQLVNVDNIIRMQGDWRNFNDVMQAGREAVRMIEFNFSQRKSFIQETTLCGRSVLKNIMTAKKLGYDIELHYIGLETAELAKERIKYRVMQGGHGVSDRDVERRFIESQEKLKIVLPLCDWVILYDNTSVFQRFAVYEKGQLIDLSENTPEWYKRSELNQARNHKCE